MDVRVTRVQERKGDMFKRGFKKVLCSGLVLGLLLGLTACGKQKEEETVSGWGEDNTALAREFVYGE